MSKKVSEIEVKVKGEGQAKSKLGSLASFIKSRFVVTLGDIVRIGKSVINFFVEASKKAQEQERVTKSLNQALKNQGIYTEETSKALQKQATELQKVTTYGDEAIISLQTQLINFGVMPDKIDSVVRATMDLATAQGMDLNTAGNLLAKSLGSSTNALARYGIEITGAVGSTERLDSAVKNIADKFGGQAKAETETLQGALKQLDNMWGDLQETIMTTNNNALTPYITGLTNILAKTNEIIQGKTFEEELIEKANALRVELGWGTKAWEDYDTAIKQIGGTEATISENTDKLTRKQKKQREEQAEQIAQLAIYDQAITNAKKLEEERLANEAKEQDRLKRLKEEAKLLEEKQAKDKAYADMMIKNRDAMIAKDIEVKDAQIKTAQETSDLLASITEDGGKTIGDAIKKQLSAQIDAWMATEIAKAQASAPLTFGASLLAIAPIIGAGTAGKAAINAVKFAQGGQFETNQPISMNTTSGNQAIAGEKGLERIKVEPVGKSSSQGNQNINVTVMLGNTELKKIAYDLKPYLNAIDRGVI